jgi:hypothetical protein
MQQEKTKIETRLETHNQNQSLHNQNHRISAYSDIRIEAYILFRIDITTRTAEKMKRGPEETHKQNRSLHNQRRKSLTRAAEIRHSCTLQKQA